MKKKHLWLFCLLCLCIGTASAQVEKTIHVEEAGNLKGQLTEDEAKNITHLTLTGNINAIDFKAMRDDFSKLEFLDLTNAKIKIYAGKKGTYPKEKMNVYAINAIPAYAFTDKKTLKMVILSPDLKSVEQNAFYGCNNLQICQIKKKKVPGIEENGFDNKVTAIFIPPGSKDEYRAKEKWQPFNLVEGDPISLSIHVTEPGTLMDKIKETGKRPEEISFLTVSGNLDLNDFKGIHNDMLKLVGIDMSDVNTQIIPEFTFAQKNYLMRMKLPNTLKRIGQRAFSGCIQLSGDITLPSSIEEIGYGAFMGCSKLGSVVAPSNKTIKIDSNIFDNSTGGMIYK